MTNFSKYLNLNQSAINNIFNTVTKEGQELIYFNDVIDIVQFFEQNKDNQDQNNPEAVHQEGLNLNVFEMKIILENFDEIIKVKSLQEMVEVLDGSALMFIVDYESRNGINSAPSIFTNVNLEMLFISIMDDPLQLKKLLNDKLLTKTETKHKPSPTNSFMNMNLMSDHSNSVNKAHPPSRASLNINSEG